MLYNKQNQHTNVTDKLTDKANLRTEGEPLTQTKHTNATHSGHRQWHRQVQKG